MLCTLIIFVNKTFCTCMFFPRTQEDSLRSSSVFSLQTTKLQPLVCPICCKTFCGRNRRQHLDHHLKTHTGEKPHSCPYCHHRTSRRDHLREHIRSIHGVNLIRNSQIQ
ncbi:hypothetical protein SK128_011851 [Halocaridina rubra]|uniref:C2H2-type domain-containing protein n=1 Tax=Halocaridina rubra TaxID=373956 RepID=A0AAN8XP08_HALRR